jgi:SAM-dependent methyltransferase
MSCAALATRRRILHVGCGPHRLPAEFTGCDEVRFDADASVEPDIVGNMTALGDIGEFDGIWCCHALEHLTPVDAMTCLREFLRVLKPNGWVTIIVPDLEGVSPTFEPLLDHGTVSGHDLIYGMRDTSNPWMQHRTGFIAVTLAAALRQAGFRGVDTKRSNDYNLVGLGIK